MKAKLLAQYSYVFKLYSIIYTFLFLIVSRLFINYFSSEDFILTKKKYIYFTIFFFFLFLISFFIIKYSFFINKIIFLRGNFNYEDLESVSEIFLNFFLFITILFIQFCLHYILYKKKIKIVMAISIFIIFLKFYT